MATEKPEPLCWLNDSRGIFLPRDFATSFAGNRDKVENVSDEDWAILERGPNLPGDSTEYWETWSEVEANAIVTMDGVKYRVYQEGDCWLIPAEMEWSNSDDWFVWPKEQDDA